MVIAGENHAERVILNRRASTVGRGSHQSRDYIHADDRFTTCEAWAEHVRQLPRTRPADLWIRFCIRDTDVTVREGQQVLSPPWHLVVEKVYTPGIPGALSQVGVVLDHPAITSNMVIESTQMIASGRIDITP